MLSPMATASLTRSLRLENHDASISQLRQVMTRVNADMSGARFLEAVTLTFQDVQARLTRGGMEERFRGEPSYLDFKHALHAARRDGRRPASVLVIGCGRGVAGEAAAFAARATKDVFAASEFTCVDEYNLTSQSLEHDFADANLPSRLYDLIVAHSTLHYVRYLAPLFSLIQTLLKRPGDLVLAHEPNACFWHTPACQVAVRDLSRARQRWRVLRYLKPAHYFARVRGSITASSSILAALNLDLRQQYGFKDDLTELEMRRIVDIHRPAAVHGDFKIGLDGLDLEALVPTHLPGAQLRWAASTGHLGYTDTSRLPGHWRRREQELRRLYPLSGCLFTGYWRQQ